MEICKRCKKEDTHGLFINKKLVLCSDCIIELVKKKIDEKTCQRE